ncbi:MAG: M1 family peptidase, partial [Calditrichaeota bacterium]
MKMQCCFLFFLAAFLLHQQTSGAQTPIYDSGGPLMPQQAAYDVKFYDLSLNVNPADSSIAGAVEMRAAIVQPIDVFVLDLDTLLSIQNVQLGRKGKFQQSLAFERRAGKIWIDLEKTWQPGESVEVKVTYSGRPRVAPRPPWDGGFTWARTPSGSPWIATTCETEGPDIWWPCKDHVSDEPDSMALHITVPGSLVVASNGRLRKVEKRPDGRKTYHWFVSTPINNYDVALNIAPYRLIETKMKSVAGETFPVKFWVLPENYEDGRKLMPEILAHLRFFERLLGPYPFRADKYGVVQTPHLGMEHQTIIAYGAKFDRRSMTRGKDWGFDALHHHELSHEWWGNLVTNADWKDMWIHEGFGTYMQALYLEETRGDSMYHAYMASLRGGAESPLAIAPRTSKTSKQIYRAPIYNKGAWVLHTLRFLIGEKALRQSLRRMLYPTRRMEKITDGRQCRFVSTSDFIYTVEK